MNEKSKNIFENNKVAMVFKPLLAILSVIYSVVIRLRQFFYKIGLFRSFRVDIKVISVGNITMGGTGKTPLVIVLSDFLMQNQKKVAISTRGYGGDYMKKGIIVDSNLSEDANFLGDEIYLFRNYLKGTPILVGKNRYKIIKQAFNKVKPDILILDDGFQHLKLKRDLNIVVINSLNPFGNKGLIPFGILREPISALRRGDIFVITKTNLLGDVSSIKNLLGRLNPEALIVCSEHVFDGLYEFEKEEDIDINSLSQSNIASICAIGDPLSFERLLANNGIEVKKNHRFLDHHRFTSHQIKGLIDGFEKDGIDTVVTTEKDMFRLKQFLGDFKAPGIRLLVARMKLKISENEREFFDRLSKVLT